MTTVERIEQIDAPRWVIPIIEREFEDFESGAGEFMDGKTEETAFIPFRLRQGVYGQRQAERQMIRVKLPFGGVGAHQLDTFAEVAEQFAPLGKGHITTRQNIQFHHVPLERSIELLPLLGRAGLSTREACGNVVRNVTGDAWAGVREDEPFDITPYAGAFTRYWVRNELTQLLPRKFKVAFTATEDDDSAMTAIHDLGFIARTRVIDGREVRGFKLVCGGGLSTMAKHAILLREFVSVDDYLRVSEAVLRIFHAADELRRNINKARLKFLVKRVGEEEFRRMVDEELKGDWARQRYDLDQLLFVDDEEADAPAPPGDAPTASDAERPAFERWVEANTRAQRQDGYRTVEVRVPQGDLNAQQFRGLASIVRDLGAGRARTTPWQNIVLRWIPRDSLYAVWRTLGELGLDGAGALEIGDIVSCPGTDSCKLGITSSMGLNRAIEAKLEDMAITDPLTRRILINISGCPNSCGMHHLGNIGFHGAALKVGERQVPSYKVFVGGERRPGEQLALGTLLKATVPAKRVATVVERLIRLYEARRSDGETFNECVARLGKQALEDEIRDLTPPPEFTTETMPTFIDWDRDGLYVLERGEGECAV